MEIKFNVLFCSKFRPIKDCKWRNPLDIYLLRKLTTCETVYIWSIGHFSNMTSNICTYPYPKKRMFN